MGKLSSKAKKLKLNAARFLKILPERKKKIDDAASEDVKPINEYKPNSIASLIHPASQHVKVSEVVTVTENSKLYKLIPDKDRGTSRLAPFASGNCISVEAEINGKKYRRPYSISSSPLEGYYEIIVKKVPGGIVSEYFHDNIKAGDSLTVSGPFGEFTYNPLRDTKTVIGIAGGVGITPFRSYVKAICDGAEDINLILLYGAAKVSDIVFKDELDKASSNDRINVIYVISGEENVPDGYEKGFVTADLIKKYAPKGDYSVFVCGPDAMYLHLEKELKKLDIRRKFIRFDYRGEPVTPWKEPDYVEASTDQYKLTVKYHGMTYETVCGKDETILKAIEKAGIYIPSKCMSGACGICHSKVVEGKYYMPKSRDGRRAADSVFGYIHPCCTFPRSDMTVMLP